MKRLFIFFLVVVMLVGCGCRSIVKHDIEGQDVPPPIKIEGDKQETSVKDTGTGANESEDYNSFPTYIYPLSAIFIGSSVCLFGYKTANSKAFFGGLAVASSGMLGGIKMVYNWITG